MSLSSSQDERSNERIDNNPRAGIQDIASMTPMEDATTKEKKAMSKITTITLPTLLRGNDSYFDHTITSHKRILSAQLMRFITPRSLNENNSMVYSEK